MSSAGQEAWELPSFTYHRIGATLADVAGLVGKALQTQRVEVDVRLSLEADHDGINTVSDTQRIVLDAFHSSGYDRYKIQIDGYGQSVECESVSYDFNHSQKPTIAQRNRLAANQTGGVTRITETSVNHGSFEPTSEHAASSRTMLAMANHARNKAIDISDRTLEEGEQAGILGQIWGLEDMLLAPTTAISLMGEVMTQIVGKLTHGNDDSTLRVDLNVDCATLRPRLYHDCEIELWAGNFVTEIEALFSLKARTPIKHDLVLTKVSLKTRHRTFPVATTIDQLRQFGGDIKRVRKHFIGKEQVGMTELHAATPQTAVAMARLALQVAKTPNAEMK